MTVTSRCTSSGRISRSPRRTRNPHVRISRRSVSAADPEAFRELVTAWNGSHGSGGRNSVVVESGRSAVAAGTVPRRARRQQPEGDVGGTRRESGRSLVRDAALADGRLETALKMLLADRSRTMMLLEPEAIERRWADCSAPGAPTSIDSPSRSASPRGDHPSQGRRAPGGLAQMPRRAAGTAVGLDSGRRRMVPLNLCVRAPP